MKHALFLFLFPLMAFAGVGAPDFPFYDWTKLRDGADGVIGGMGYCGKNEGELAAASYLIERKDGVWRIAGAANRDESDRWYAMWINEEDWLPKWVYLGHTEINKIVLEEVVPFDVNLHNEGCKLLFPNQVP